MFLFNSIDEYQKRLYEGEINCCDTTAYYLEKIDANKKLNVFVKVYASESTERAKILDQKRKSGKACGKLHGVIIAIKDVICYKDHTITAA